MMERTKHLIEQMVRVEHRFKRLSYTNLLEHLPHTLEQIKGKNRAGDLIMSRQLAIFVHYLESDCLNLTATGKEFNRDHATTIYSIKGVAKGVLGFDQVRQKFFSRILDSIDLEVNNTTDINHLLILEDKLNELKNKT